MPLFSPALFSLDPYSEYMLKVHACNDGQLYDSTHDYCGGSEISSGRTMKDKNADKISNLRTVVTSKDELVDSVSIFCPFNNVHT